uniref:Uncharacterized protein n=1 Tax=Timema bartmani TaxID=61472 RepID=A0A7R9F5Q3_9NEOP|nr:unnamed protein product [Timema bartmani]
MHSLLTNVNSISSPSELARTISVLDAVIWISQAVKKLLPETVTRCFENAGVSMNEATACIENENYQQDIQNCMNEAAFNNCNGEDYINIDNNLGYPPILEDNSCIQLLYDLLDVRLRFLTGLYHGDHRTDLPTSLLILVPVDILIGFRVDVTAQRGVVVLVRPIGGNEILEWVVSRLPLSPSWNSSSRLLLYSHVIILKTQRMKDAS